MRGWGTLKARATELWRQRRKEVWSSWRKDREARGSGGTRENIESVVSHFEGYHKSQLSIPNPAPLMWNCPHNFFFIIYIYSSPFPQDEQHLCFLKGIWEFLPLPFTSESGCSCVRMSQGMWSNHVVEAKKVELWPVLGWLPLGNPICATLSFMMEKKQKMNVMINVDTFAKLIMNGV